MLLEAAVSALAGRLKAAVLADLPDSSGPQK
jgi:hypothetical protein